MKRKNIIGEVIIAIVKGFLSEGTKDDCKNDMRGGKMKDGKIKEPGVCQMDSQINNERKENIRNFYSKVIKEIIESGDESIIDMYRFHLNFVLRARLEIDSEYMDPFTREDAIKGIIKRGNVALIKDFERILRFTGLYDDVLKFIVKNMVKHESNPEPRRKSKIPVTANRKKRARF